MMSTNYPCKKLPSKTNGSRGGTLTPDTRYAQPSHLTRGQGTDDGLQQIRIDPKWNADFPHANSGNQRRTLWNRRARLEGIHATRRCRSAGTCATNKARPDFIFRVGRNDDVGDGTFRDLKTSKRKPSSHYEAVPQLGGEPRSTVVFDYLVASQDPHGHVGHDERSPRQVRELIATVEGVTHASEQGHEWHSPYCGNCPFQALCHQEHGLASEDVAMTDTHEEVT